MEDTIRAMIRKKNEAFDQLSKADRRIAQREHSAQKGNADPVPWNWIERQIGLDVHYERVKAALRQVRDHAAQLERQREVDRAGD